MSIINESENTFPYRDSSVSSNEIPSNNQNIKLKYIVKVKRGAFWSERVMVIEENKVQYFKRSGEKRFDENIIDCNLINEENITDLKKHTVILVSKNKKFEDVKLKNDEAYIINKDGKAYCDKPNLTDFIKDFKLAQAKIISNSKFGRSAEKISKIMEKEKNLKKSLSIDLSTDSEFKLTSEEVDNYYLDSQKEYEGIQIKYKNINQTSNFIESSKNESKESFHCMRIEKVISNSLDVPLTEIFKTFLNQNFDSTINFNSSEISTNTNLDYLNCIFNKKSDFLNEKISITDQIQSNNLESIKKDKKGNLVLETLCLLSLNLFFKGFDNNFLLINGITFIFLIILIFLNKPLILKKDQLYHHNNAIVKITNFLNFSFTDIVEFFSSSKKTKDFMENLYSIDDYNKEALKLTFMEGSKEIVLNIKRLAVKRKNLFLIGEFITNDLIKLTSIECFNEYYCKISVFLSMDSCNKHCVPEVFISNTLNSINMILAYFNKREFNELTKNLNSIEINNLLLRSNSTVEKAKSTGKKISIYDFK